MKSKDIIEEYGLTKAELQSFGIKEKDIDRGIKESIRIIFQSRQEDTKSIGFLLILLNHYSHKLEYLTKILNGLTIILIFLTLVLLIKEWS